jgi:hypothetical protein
VSNIKAICYVIHLIQLVPTQFTCNKSLAYTHMEGMVFELQDNTPHQIATISKNATWTSLCKKFTIQHRGVYDLIGRIQVSN